jgi:hypothetical protein
MQLNGVDRWYWRRRGGLREQKDGYGRCQSPKVSKLQIVVVPTLFEGCRSAGNDNVVAEVQTESTNGVLQSPSMCAFAPSCAAKCET